MITISATKSGERPETLLHRFRTSGQLPPRTLRTGRRRRPDKIISGGLP